MAATAIAAACGTFDVGVGQPVTGKVYEFGYDAVDSTDKRRPSTGLLRSEDDELRPLDRRKLIAQTRDVGRNFVVAAWMLRRHLDYVSSFSLQMKTGKDALNKQVESVVERWSKPQAFDVAGRHGRAMFTRLTEARAVLDGDCAMYRLADGRSQGIEGDRIRTPTGGLPAGLDPSQFIHGVKADGVGAALAYAICKRGKTSDFAPAFGEMQFERLVDARHVHLHGYFDRFDQVRGVSPLAPAINTLIDLYEGLDYALVKMKVAQLFALALFRNADGPLSGDPQDYSQIRLGKKPFVLDLDPGDKAEFLEAKTPSTEFQSFTQLMLQLVLKALDIPYSFFNESFSNYSGSRQALLMYEQSADIKRQNLRAMLDNWLAWRLALGMVAGEIPFLAPEQMRWDWVSTGIPWIDPLKEITADISAVGAGLASRTEILKYRGRNFEDVVTELAAEKERLEAAGLPVNTSPNNALVTELAANGQ